jgi:hypothetical protein
MSFLGDWWTARCKRGFFFSIRKPWPGEDRLDNQKPIEKKESPLWKWLNKRR